MPCTDCHLNDAFLNGQIYTNQHIDAEGRIVEIIHIPFFSDNSDNSRMVQIIIDISGRVAPNGQEADWMNSASQREKLKSLEVLVSGVAHEINNPNNYISLNAPIVKESWNLILPILDDIFIQRGDYEIGSMKYSELRDTVSLLIDGIIDGADRIKRIVKELRSVASPSLSATLAPTSVNEALRSVIVLMDHQIRKRTDRFVVDLEESLPLILADRKRIEQVFINMLQNACEAISSRDAAITVTTRHRPRDKSISISFHDQGCGIAPENMGRLFDPFFTTKQNRGSAGLGLAICHRFVSECGGTIKVQSRIGCGATFIISLPVLHQESNGNG